MTRYVAAIGSPGKRDEAPSEPRTVIKVHHSQLGVAEDRR